MSTSAVGSVLDAIRAGLILRAGLSGVNVFSAPVSLEEAGQECVAFGDMRLNEEELTSGGNRLEEWDIDGELRVLKPWAGGTELTIKAARDRALAIFAEVESYINDTYLSTLPVVTVTAGTIEPYIGAEGRVTRMTFTLTLQADKNP